MSTEALRAVRLAVTTTAQLLDGLTAEDKDALEAGLARRGWKAELVRSKRLSKEGVSGGILTAAMAYREFNGLPPSADGMAILKALGRPCCGLPDDTRRDPETGLPVERAVTFGQWDPDWNRDTPVRVGYRFSRLPDRGDHITPDEVRDAMQAGLDRWMAFCGVRLEMTDDFGSAEIHVQDHSIDRQHSVLADMMLPGPGRVRGGRGGVRCRGRFDWNEAWCLRTKARPDIPDRMAIDFEWVWSHELGHALGFDHEPGMNQELMNPGYWPGPSYFVRGQHWMGPKDTRTAQDAYGPPRQQPDAPGPGNPGPDPQPGGEAWQIERGTLYVHGRLTRLT